MEVEWRVAEEERVAAQEVVHYIAGHEEADGECFDFTGIDGLHEVTPVSWSPARDLTYEEWRAVGGSLKAHRDSLNWWVGDWLNYGDMKFGEAAAQLHDLMGWGYPHVKKVKYVAGHVKKELRVPILSWTHHRMVASLPENAQRYWLRQAVESRWSVRSLRKAIEAVEPEPEEEPGEAKTAAQEEGEGDLFRAAAYKTLGEFRDVATWRDFLEAMEEGAQTLYVDLADKAQQLGAIQGLMTGCVQGDIDQAIVITDAPLYHVTVKDAIQEVDAAFCLSPVGTAIYMGRNQEEFAKHWRGHGLVAALL